MGHTTLVEQPS